jgi:pentatricopeptide repeat protein
MAMASPANQPPPGLSPMPAARSVSDGSNVDETAMVNKVRAGDSTGALKILSDATVRMPPVSSRNKPVNGRSLPTPSPLIVQQNVNVRMANMAFGALVETGKSVDSAALEVLQVCERNNLRPTLAIYINVLSMLDKKSPPEAVLAWLARMRDAGFQPDTAACNVQLKAHLRMQDFGAASTLLAAMIRSTSNAVDSTPPPDEISFNTVIQALGDSHRPEKAESILSTMLDAGFTPSLVTFTSVISAHAKASRPADAARVLKRLLSSSTIRPDTVVFNTVLNAYANAADPSGARAMLTMLEEQADEDCPSAKPDLVSYNTLLLACANASQPIDAETAFAALQKRGLVPNLVSYSTVLAAHARAGGVAEAQAWLDSMIRAGIAPDAVSYNTVCSAHARRGDHPAALRCFRQMEAGGVSVTPTTHAIMVNALVRAGDLEAAERALAALVSSGERLSAASFNALITAHSRAGSIPKAEATFNAMIEAHVRPSLVTFNALASAHAFVGDVQSVEGVVRRAEERGLRPDRYTYGALLQACVKAAGTGAGAAARERIAERARTHVSALLQSGVPLNDFLRSTCARVLGSEAAFARMTQEHQQVKGRSGLRSGSMRGAGAGAGGAGGGSAAAVPSPSPAAWTTVGRGQQRSSVASWRSPPIASPAVPVAAAASVAEATLAEATEAAEEASTEVMAEEPMEVMDAADAVEVAIDEEGWTMKTRRRRSAGRSPTREASSSRRAANPSLTSSIKKPRPPPPTRTSTRPAAIRRPSTEQLNDATSIGSSSSVASAAVLPEDVRLVGVPLTRSKSARARLLLLAKDICGSGELPNLSDLPDVKLSGLPMQRSSSARLRHPAFMPGALVDGPGLPMTRSAHSELALSIETSMAI